MSRPRNTTACARCQQSDVRFATTWPEGRICRRCYQRATRIHGTCPICNTDRLLPGLIGGAPACGDCAGIPKDFHCSRCGREDEPVRAGLCAHCCLADDLTNLFDTGDGEVAPHLQSLLQALTSQKHARSAKIWLITNPEATGLVRSLARGEVPLEHTTFTEHPRPSKVAFLRELCIEHGLLDHVHLDIERFQSWLQTKTASADPADGRLITQYARWVHLNRMRHLAETGQLKKGTFLSAKQSTTVAIDFLAHLRQSDTAPADCTQAHIDSWLTGGPTTRSLARGFIRWAMKHGHLPALEIPYRVAKTAPIITQQQRVDHIRRLVDPTTPLRPLERTAALLLLLYGQPLTRIASMRLNQIHATDTTIGIRFKSDHLHIPEPFAAIVRAHLHQLPNLNTSAHRDNIWLFPGGQPGQHIHQSTLMNLLRDAGIDLRGAKNASLRELVLQMPAPIVADSFNYSYTVTEQHRRNAGAQFIDYLSKRL
ncbi:hypothetical protein LLS1_38850 [Leifsonia sp. LS1]|uniref:hypothetical protein n=1 Tax=Leifsonia sp. LS1 TaxID=2828483 RepID=UPI001CFDB66A|nr:hypothetical protein [Leifsonia sp. LS1]GIT82216.1 hypothetical protein LLS1_38850 [Leifsonia sp. LS1]